MKISFAEQPSIADALSAAHGRPAGFDYLRLGLAVAILLIHCFEVPYPQEAMGRWMFTFWHPFFAIPVPAFFALSGFLVAGSLQRCATLFTFLGLRAIRIFPALAAEVLISALILGPLVTTLPLQTYFTDQSFLHYFLNIVGDIHFYLPGVFEQNPEMSMVNSQLWTVPEELECYIVLSVLSVLGLTSSRRALLIVTTAAQVGIAAFLIIRSRGADLHSGLDASTVHQHVPLLCFLFGVILFLYKERIRCSGFLAICSAGLCFVLLSNLAIARFVPIPAAYLTVYIGVQNPRRWAVIESGDYSYGIYLFSMPVLQTVVSLGVWAHNWLTVILIGVPATLLFAVSSWHLLEKHALRLRSSLFGFEKRFLVFRNGAMSSLRSRFKGA